MSRSEISTEFNTFVGGILTEANPINFPPGYALDEENFVLERSGTLRRRRGLNFESNLEANMPSSFWNTFSNSFSEKKWAIWKNVGTKDSTKDLLVVSQPGLDKVKIFDMADPDNIAEAFLSDVPLPTMSSGDVTNIVTSGDKLYIASTRVVLAPPDSSVGAITTYPTPVISVYRFDSSTDTAILEHTSPILMRDFYRYFPNIDTLEQRPAVMSISYNYDLLNSGWTQANIIAFQAAVGAYPSVSDNMTSGLDPVTGVFNSSWVVNANNGLSTAGNGRNIVDAFKPERWREYFLENATGVGQNFTPSLTDDPYIKKMVVFNGRLFYLCNNARNSNNVTNSMGRGFVAFSQNITTTTESFANCYSLNDPSARDFNQPLDTDGGVLAINELGDVLDILSLKNRLIVFGTEGVFEIVSRQGIFRPADLSVRKITDVTMSYTYSQDNSFDATWTYSNSAVVAGSDVYYISDSGVIKLSSDSDSDLYVATVVSPAIRSLLNNIPTHGKSIAQGVFIPSDNTIRWLYKTTDIEGPAPFWNAMSKDAELVYDLTLNSWYKNTFVASDLNGATIIPALYAPLLISTGNRSSQTEYSVDNNLRYLSSGTAVDGWVQPGFKLCRYSDTSFTDYAYSQDTTGYDYTSFLQTGYLNANDSAKFKQGNYIVPSFIRTEDGFTDDGSGNLTANNESSCIISAWWDFAEEDTDTKVNPPFEAYRLNKVYIPTGPADTFDYGQSVITTKNRLTGRGRALSLRFESSVGKDCRLLGWQLGFGAVTKV